MLKYSWNRLKKNTLTCDKLSFLFQISAVIIRNSWTCCIIQSLIDFSTEGGSLKVASVSKLGGLAQVPLCLGLNLYSLNSPIRICLWRRLRTLNQQWDPLDAWVWHHLCWTIGLLSFFCFHDSSVMAAVMYCALRAIWGLNQRANICKCVQQCLGGVWRVIRVGCGRL